MSETLPTYRIATTFNNAEQWIISNLGLTPVCVVLGGSSVTWAFHDRSDVDISVYVTDSYILIDDDGSEVEQIMWMLDSDLLKSQLAIADPIKIDVKAYTVDWADDAVFNNQSINPYWKIYIVEDLLAYPVIYENSGIDALRAKCATIPLQTRGEWYKRKSFEFSEGKPDDHNRMMAVRQALTGAHLLSKGTYELDIRTLFTNAGFTFDWVSWRDQSLNPDRLRDFDYLRTEIEQAQSLLQQELDK